MTDSSYAYCDIFASKIAKAFKNNDIEGLKKAGAELCMECGCCSFNCPANRPITQTNKLSKAVLREAAMKEKEAQK